jgi:hypothetical protein
VNLAFDGFDPTGLPVNLYELKGSAGGIWDSRVTYNGVTDPNVTSPDGLPGPLTDTSGSSTYLRTVPAYSMTMVEFAVNSGHSKPVLRVSSPADRGTFAAGSDLTLSADAFATQGTLSRVEFYQDDTLIGTAVGGTSTLWGGVQPGTYAITARAYDDGGGVSVSAPVTINVTGGGQPSRPGAAHRGAGAGAWSLLPPNTSVEPGAPVAQTSTAVAGDAWTSLNRAVYAAVTGYTPDRSTDPTSRGITPERTRLTEDGDGAAGLTDRIAFSWEVGLVKKG